MSRTSTSFETCFATCSRMSSSPLATIVILAMVLIAEYWGLTRLVNLLVGSIAIISGVVAFACQSIFRDFFEGLVISVSRPFDIGDRLLLESVDRPCVVEEITVVKNFAESRA